MKSFLLKPVHRCLALLAFPAAALLSGCQAVVTGSSAAQVRVIDTSPDSPGLDIYQGSTAAAYNLGFGTVTSYISVDPGIYSLSAAAAGTHQTLVSAKATFVAGSQYTLLIGNTLNSLQELVLKDQSLAAPSGQISLRLLDQATGAGPVDVYLMPSGQTLAKLSPILTNVVFAANTGYFNVPAGAYTLVIYPAGTVHSNDAFHDGDRHRAGRVVQRLAGHLRRRLRYHPDRPRSADPHHPGRPGGVGYRLYLAIRDPLTP